MPVPDFAKQLGHSAQPLVQAVQTALARIQVAPHRKLPANTQQPAM